MRFEGRQVAAVVLVVALTLCLSLLQVSEGKVRLNPKVRSFPFANDGIVNPAEKYEKYRRDEYPKTAPFYQWWYYCIKDLEEQHYYVLTYSTSQSKEGGPTQNEGSYFLFGEVDHSESVRLTKYEKYPVDATTFSNYFDINCCGKDSNLSKFELNVIDSNTYNLYGRMRDPAHAWETDAKVAALDVEWNVTLHRIFGWDGEWDLLPLLDMSGLIGWNTYSHDAEVEGTIRIGNRTYELTRSSRYRAYGDQNWGKYFPSGPSYKKYNWGWYSVVEPSDNLAKEVSIIAGTGVSDDGFPIYSAFASFADVRIGDFHLGCRYGGFWDYTSMKVIPLETSNDGKCHMFNITHSDWHKITDEYGTAELPLVQTVLFESDHYQVRMDFTSKLTDYNRLLFPHEDYLFSDFEGLGALATATVKKRNSLSEPFSEVILDTTTYNSGIEFGYRPSS